jgi:hypothetical protein
MPCGFSTRFFRILFWLNFLFRWICSCPPRCYLTKIIAGFFFSSTRWRNTGGRLLWCQLNRQGVRKGVWERVKQTKRPRWPIMWVVVGESVSEKSQTTRTVTNVFEKSNSKTQYFVREVNDRRMTKNGVKILIRWRDFPLDKDDSWEPITNLPGSIHHDCRNSKSIDKKSTKLKRQNNFSDWQEKNS